MTELEIKIKWIMLLTNQLETCAEEYESHLRRNNCRIIAVDHFGAEKPEHTLAKIIRETLMLDYTPTLTGPKGATISTVPHVIKFHNFQEKIDVLQKATAATATTASSPPNKKAHIYLDYTISVRKKRAAFNEVRALLRKCPGIRHGLSYPATLRITG